jgi:hypothetical protein
VAALIAVVGILIARGLLDVAVLAPTSAGTWGDASTAQYAVGAIGVALLATAIMHILLLTTPSPFAFFGWLMGLATLAGAVVPFTISARVSAQVATATINAIIGLAIWILLENAAHRCVARVGWTPPPQPV